MKVIRNTYAMNQDGGGRNLVQGYFLFCLTLDPNADTYVKRIFGTNN